MKRNITSSIIFMIFFSISAFEGAAQLTLPQLIKYIRLDFDDLDDNLSKQNFKFKNDNQNEGERYGIGMQSYIWKNSKTGNTVTMYIQQDTISLKTGDYYTGYSDVNKYSLSYTVSFNYYNNLLGEIKKSSLFKKESSNIENNTISTKYMNDDFYVIFIKHTTPSKTLYGIQLLDKSYEIIETSLEGGKKFKHSKKRIKPFFD